jgi:hypothetical protein
MLCPVRIGLGWSLREGEGKGKDPKLTRAQITSLPTLLAFSRQEAQFDTKLFRPQDMQNKDILRQWLLNEARRGGRKGGGGGSLFGW